VLLSTSLRLPECSLSIRKKTNVYTILPSLTPNQMVEPCRRMAVSRSMPSYRSKATLRDHSSVYRGQCRVSYGRPSRKEGCHDCRHGQQRQSCHGSTQPRRPPVFVPRYLKQPFQSSLMRSMMTERHASVEFLGHRMVPGTAFKRSEQLLSGIYHALGTGHRSTRRNFLLSPDDTRRC
jgi:hypothetical protein